MAEIREDTTGKTRDLPIAPKLRPILLAAAAAANVDVVRVTSGGQCRKGTCQKRTGSERHDEGNAADLQLLVGGSALKFTRDADRQVFERFVTEAARSGATGIGAGLDYMGDATIHIGFGARAVWGAGGRAAQAPEWIRLAAIAGWQLGGGRIPKDLEDFESLDSPDEEVEEDYKD